MLVVAYSLTVGSLRYDTQAAALVLRRGVLPIVDRLDVAMPRRVRVDAAAGDEVTLSLDAGDGSADVFTGTVGSVRRGPTMTTIVARGAAHALARHRPSISLEQVTVGEVIVQLCGDVGVDTAEIDDGPTLARYVAAARSTALDEVARLAGLAGATATVTASGAVRATTSPSAETRLTYGREVLDVDVAAPGGDEVAFTLVGDGAGEPGTPSGLWPTDDFWAGGARDAGPGVRRRVDHELRSTGDATLAGDAWTARDAAARTPARLRCWLQPSLAPGDRLDVAGAPDDLGLGPLHVRQVVHSIEPGGAAITEVWGAHGAADSSGGLLRAIGSLL